MNTLKFFSLLLVASMTIVACTPQASVNTNASANVNADAMMEGDNMEKDDSMEKDSMMEGDNMEKDGAMMDADGDGVMEAGDSAMMEATGTTNITLSTGLVDVTNGLEVRGLLTNVVAGGTVRVTYDGSTYSLVAEFTDLPEPQGDDFYEGWVVRQETQSVVSTGRLQEVNGQYRNTFESNIDLTDHTLYVLTIEPNDGDPAPADHIVEGRLQLQ